MPPEQIPKIANYMNNFQEEFTEVKHANKKPPYTMQGGSIQQEMFIRRLQPHGSFQLETIRLDQVFPDTKSSSERGGPGTARPATLTPL